ncbi:hypothetical protein ANO11243_093500 [Dothideomycetidae sp. 11243]|nr:hypothetical protein ANO11243_093500 [fungal sp. No.11243]
MATATTNYGALPFATLNNILQLGVSILFLLLTTLTVGLRLYVRRVYTKKLALDDWVLVAAWIAYILFVVTNLGWVAWIVDRGMAATWWETYTVIGFWKVPFAPCAILVRAAIATFFLRTLPPATHGKQRIAILAALGFYTALLITLVFLDIFQCGMPMPSNWANYYSITCVDPMALNGMFIFSGVMTTGLDWVMTLIPVYLVIRSKMPRRDKITSACILCLAGSGSVLAILSIVNPNISSVGWPSDLPHFDTYVMYRVGENGLAIIVVSLAAVRPLISKVRLRFKQSRTAGSDQSNGVEAGSDHAVRDCEKGEQSEKGFDSPDLVYLTEVESGGSSETKK